MGSVAGAMTIDELLAVAALLALIVMLAIKPGPPEP